jgi:uncharacterized membrane protein YkvA (DUF1232 family)
MSNLRAWAKALKRDVITLWFALKHPLTPWHARALAAVLTAYALSPIDLIPDFIPILGYLDDLIIVPVGVWLLLRMVPTQVLTDSKDQADGPLTRPFSEDNTLPSELPLRVECFR